MFPIFPSEIISDVTQSRGATWALQPETRPASHWVLSNTKAKGQLLFISMLVPWFFWVTSSDKGVLSLIFISLSKVRKVEINHSL